MVSSYLIDEFNSYIKLIFLFIFIGNYGFYINKFRGNLEFNFIIG